MIVELRMAGKMHPNPGMLTAFRSAVVVVGILSTTAACSLNEPVTGTGHHSTATSGTVAGLVSTDAGKTPVVGRMVTATNTSTNAHFDGTTATNGGYTLMVPAGRYALDVELREGERLAKRPEPTNVGIGDLDSARDFVIAR